MDSNKQKHRDVKSRLIRVVGASTLGQGLNAGIQLAKLPLFLAFWGVDLYGEWLVISAIPSILGSSNVGFASATSTDMILLAEQGKKQEAKHIFQSTFALLLTVITVLFVLSSFACFAPLASWLPKFKMSLITPEHVVYLLPLFVAQFGIRQMMHLINAGFRSQKNFVRAAMWTNAMNFFAFTGVVIALVMGKGVIGVAVFTLFFQIATLIGMRLDLRACNDWVRFGFHKGGFQKVKKLIGPAFAYMCLPAGLAMRRQLIVIVITTCISPVAVVLFVALRTMANTAFQMQRLVSRAVWPELSVAQGAGEKTLVRTLHRRAFQASLLIALVTSIGLAIGGTFLLDKWTGGKIEMDLPVFCVLLVSSSLNSLWITSSVVAMSVNQHGRQAVLHLIFTAAGLAISLLLTPMYGLVGAAASLLFIDIPMLGYVVYESLKLSEDRFSAFAKSLLARPGRARMS